MPVHVAHTHTHSYTEKYVVYVSVAYLVLRRPPPVCGAYYNLSANGAWANAIDPVNEL